MTHFHPGGFFFCLLCGPQGNGTVQLPVNHTFICIFVTDLLAPALANTIVL